jgi:hypothetical protein
VRHDYRSFVTLLGGAVGAAILFWLLRDHWGHALGLLPYLLFLTCPLMHLFMHHGHRHHDHRASTEPRPGEQVESA